MTEEAMKNEAPQRGTCECGHLFGDHSVVRNAYCMTGGCGCTQFKPSVPAPLAKPTVASESETATHDLVCGICQNCGESFEDANDENWGPCLGAKPETATPKHVIADEDCLPEYFNDDDSKPETAACPTCGSDWRQFPCMLPNTPEHGLGWSTLTVGKHMCTDSWHDAKPERIAALCKACNREEHEYCDDPECSCVNEICVEIRRKERIAEAVQAAADRVNAALKPDALHPNMGGIAEEVAPRQQRMGPIERIADTMFPDWNCPEHDRQWRMVLKGLGEAFYAGRKAEREAIDRKKAGATLSSPKVAEEVAPPVQSRELERLWELQIWAKEHIHEHDADDVCEACVAWEVVERRLRHEIDELTKVEAGATLSSPKEEVSPRRSWDSSVPHVPTACGSRYCAQHRDIWHHYERVIAGAALSSETPQNLQDAQLFLEHWCAAELHTVEECGCNVCRAVRLVRIGAASPAPAIRNQFVRPAFSVDAEDENAPAPASTPELCHKATKYHLIAGASSYACMLPKGHKGECQPGGNCFKHGPYVGTTQCPQWPKCMESYPPESTSVKMSARKFADESGDWWALKELSETQRENVFEFAERYCGASPAQDEHLTEMTTRAHGAEARLEAAEEELVELKASPAQQEPIAELITIHIEGTGRNEEFACLMGYQPPEGVRVLNRQPLFAVPPAELKASAWKDAELVDCADGVAGHYCIGRKEGAFMSFWNPDGWAGSGYLFTDKRIAEAVMGLPPAPSQGKGTNCAKNIALS